MNMTNNLSFVPERAQTATMKSTKAKGSQKKIKKKKVNPGINSSLNKHPCETLDWSWS